MFLLYHAYVYLEFLILACTIYILEPINTLKKIEQAVDIMKKNNVDLVDIKPFEKYSFNECSGWGNCFENNKLSKFI